MICIIKKSSFIIICIFALQSCIIQNSKQENCERIEITVEEIYEGDIKDIAFSDPDGRFFCTKKGLDQGMNNKVLNKKLTLHLAKIITGKLSNHMAQLPLGQEVIYTEFN
jgi:hypothetical protein